MEPTSLSRREFAIRSAFLAGSTLLAPEFRFDMGRRPVLSDEVLGHGNFRYRAEIGWGKADQAQTPVNNCHEMVMNSRGRLIMATDEPRNNVIVYDKSGREPPDPAKHGALATRSPPARARAPSAA